MYPVVLIHWNENDVQSLQYSNSTSKITSDILFWILLYLLYRLQCANIRT